MNSSVRTEQFINSLSSSGVFSKLLARLNSGVWAELFHSKRMKFAGLFALVVLYVVYKHKKKGYKKLFKDNERNRKLFEWLKPVLDSYSPTWYLPFGVLQVIRGVRNRGLLVKFEKQQVALSDGGELILEWHPSRYSAMSAETPIVAFVLGAAGVSSDAYCKILTRKVIEKGWRIVVLNRVGFSYTHIKSNRFISKNEHQDFHEAILKIKEIFSQAPIYMMGVSAGANNTCRYLGNFPSSPVEAAVSISNPFNIGRISFYTKQHFWANLFSRYIAHETRNLYRFHKGNPIFSQMFAKDEDLAELEQKLDQKSLTCWRLDKMVTSKISGHDSIFDYYNNVSCEFVLQDIKTPLLVINNMEDPICLKESIPIERLFSNENIFSIIFHRGGHIEYLSGWNEDFHAFNIALRYFDNFEQTRAEKKAKNIESFSVNESDILPMNEQKVI